MKKLMKRFYPAILVAAVAATVTAGPAHAARMGFPSASRSEAASDASDLRVPNPHKELRHLSKNLKLTKDQRVVVDSILQERTREIRLLLDVDPLSQEYRNTIAAKVMEDSNARIESLLRSKQKRKFDRELTKDGGTRE